MQIWQEDKKWQMRVVKVMQDCYAALHWGRPWISNPPQFNICWTSVYSVFTILVAYFMLYMHPSWRDKRWQAYVNIVSGVKAITVIITITYSTVLFPPLFQPLYTCTHASKETSDTKMNRSLCVCVCVCVLVCIFYLFIFFICWALPVMDKRLCLMDYTEFLGD